MSRVRVLIADDSAFARKVIREALSRSPDIEVIDFARDGLEALEKISEQRPDVVTLDLVMPNLDGIGVLRALPQGNRPAVVVVSISDSDSDLVIDALELGAVDLVHKPTALAIAQLYSISDELVAKVLAAAGARPARARARAPIDRVPPAVTTTRVVVIGASAGGPQAITRMLSALPRELPVPIAVALHLPAEYTGTFARRLDDLCQLSVREATDGLTLEPGMAVIARGGAHLEIYLGGDALIARVGSELTEDAHRPSVDVLFESAARAVGRDVIAVVLTGMGDDGLRGARAVRAAGGTILTESEQSCVVYGMPRTVRDAGLSQAEAVIDEMAGLLLSRIA